MGEPKVQGAEGSQGCFFLLSLLLLIYFLGLGECWELSVPQIKAGHRAASQVHSGFTLGCDMQQQNRLKLMLPFTESEHLHPHVVAAILMQDIFV